VEAESRIGRGELEGRRILFGTAGIPAGAGDGADTLYGIRMIRELGLAAMELAFVHRVNVGRKLAPIVRAVACEENVALSVHASYYINLNSRDGQKVKASRKRLLSAARTGHLCGAKNIVFHAGWRHNDSDERVYNVVAGHLKELAQILAEEGTVVTLCPETTGKPTQFGDLEELLRLARDVPGVNLCVDFAHLHARSGQANSEPEFHSILDAIEAALGLEALRDMHMHVSGIDYGERGEIRHLMLSQSDFEYEALLRVLWDRKVSGTLICESPMNDSDAMVLSQTWDNIASGWRGEHGE